MFSGYVAWCEACGWNLNPLTPARVHNLFELINASLGGRQTQELLAQVVRQGQARPAFSSSRWLAYLLAALVHGLTLGLALVGAALLLRGWPRLPLLLLGLLCIGLAWLLRPRFSPPPPPPLDPGAHPGLYKLVNDISARLGGPLIQHIYANEWFNAAASRESWRGVPVLYLGLPLWAILSDDEKLALLSHELAHLVNNDPSRGAFIGLALEMLGRWYGLLRPARIWNPETGLAGFVLVPLNLLLMILARGAWFHAAAMSLLIWRDQQRAEYYADALAARQAGVPAVLALLDKLHFARTFETSLRSAVLDPALQGQDLFAHLRVRVAQVPGRELERIRRVELLEASRLDARHPPTALRIQYLRSLADLPPAARLALDWAAVESELAPARRQAQVKLVDGYLSALYKH